MSLKDSLLSRNKLPHPFPCLFDPEWVLGCLQAFLIISVKITAGFQSAAKFIAGKSSWRTWVWFQKKSQMLVSITSVVFQESLSGRTVSWVNLGWYLACSFLIWLKLFTWWLCATRKGSCTVYCIKPKKEAIYFSYQSFNTDLCNSRLYKYLCVYTYIYILKLKTSFSVLFLTLFKIHTI